MPRGSSSTKPAYSRNITKFRVSKEASVSSVNEAEVIEQFRLHRERAREKHPIDDDEDADEDAVRRRISYTKEQKLAAIRYAKTTMKSQPDGRAQPITKYAASSNLGISTKMLRDWINKEHEIAGLHSGARKNRGHVENLCQEPELETRLYELFKDARKSGQEVSKGWFLRHGKQIYGSLYPDRIVKHPGKPTSYSGFKFSDGWFQNFRRRMGISTRNLTKKSYQQGPEDFQPRLISWLQKDIPNLQFNGDRSSTAGQEDEQAVEDLVDQVNDHDGDVAHEEGTKKKPIKREYVLNDEKDVSEEDDVNQTKTSDDSEMDDDR